MEHLVMITSIPGTGAWYSDFIGHIFKVGASISPMNVPYKAYCVISRHFPDDHVIGTPFCETVTLERQPNESYKDLAARWVQHKKDVAQKETKIAVLRAQITEMINFGAQAAKLRQPHTALAASIQVSVLRVQLMAAIGQPVSKGIKYKGGTADVSGKQGPEIVTQPARNVGNYKPSPNVRPGHEPEHIAELAQHDKRAAIVERVKYHREWVEKFKQAIIEAALSKEATYQIAASMRASQGEYIRAQADLKEFDKPKPKATIITLTYHNVYGSEAPTTGEPHKSWEEANEKRNKLRPDYVGIVLIEKVDGKITKMELI